MNNHSNVCRSSSECFCPCVRSVSVMSVCMHTEHFYLQQGCAHMDLSRGVSPNGTAGTKDITILKGDISQLGPCRSLQPDHNDSLTGKTGRQEKRGTGDCGVQNIWNMRKGLLDYEAQTPVLQQQEPPNRRPNL